MNSDESQKHQDQTTGRGVNSLISDVEPRPHFVCVVTGCFARVQQPLQLGHAQGTGDALGVFPAWRPGAAPGPGEPGHERHLGNRETGKRWSYLTIKLNRVE